MEHLSLNTQKKSFIAKKKSIFSEQVDPKIASYIAERENQYTKTFFALGAILWLVWILFDILFAHSVWLLILPTRIVGCLSFAIGYFIADRLHWQIKQNYIVLYTSLAISFMFSLIPEGSFFAYFTGAIFVNCLFYTTLYITRLSNLIYTAAFLSMIITPIIFNTLSFVDVLKNGVFAMISILFLMVFVADINRKNIIIFYQNMEKIKEQNQELEEKNKSIIESITYAQRIQKSILPRIKDLQAKLSGLSVIYKPKDIVSGDFYWYSQENENIFIVVADCTGHGVPGAFITLINHIFLNQAVLEKHILNTNQILHFVREKLVYTISSDENTKIRDGMDVALLNIDKSNMSIEFSGANRPLWMVQKQNPSELIEINGDKLFVGFHEGWDQTYFLSHSYKIQQGDRIYLFTDGITDLFGGTREKGSKFGKKRLRELILNTFHYPIDEQKKHIEAYLENWQGNLPQVDDICMVCVEV